MTFGLGEFLGAVGIAGVPAALALTMTVATKAGYRFLKACLIVSGAFVIIPLLFMQWTVDWGPTYMKVLVNAAVAAIVVGGISYGLEWLRKKETSASAETSTSQRGPTLEATNNSTIDASGATIPGDLPFQFGKADQNSLLSMPGAKVTKTENGWQITPPENITFEFPAASPKYAAMTLPDLKRELLTTANSLRLLQNKYTASFREARSDTTNFRNFADAFRSEYEKNFAERSFALASAALSKLGPVTLSQSATNGGAVVYYKKFVGPTPAGDAASFLEALSEKLPKR
ncbi:MULTISPECIES: hypothetical protein [Bradyrhizobium]|jgi:hypothetical protein|uniref:hypothetical protein n=1 Tax=Bradyrhizobium TaxID=374 RepID=UPI000489149C|nr:MULTISPECIES: hypothetical protein [Bradyrhizobium]MCS3449557.1 hypothetical protein [Bradyrhizobium elkanii]MCS3559300.1 hypothetical protein [Bradyrhizobium elkanii]MCW2150854.1 hypothetical protein [Bradyrhizobium elkanii]MCW2359104.1 hypothetical protein [Bradyrhizobium elkanii]MCW2374585.1 hypothetical protein [Bradyrhizobium elkanii]